MKKGRLTWTLLIAIAIGPSTSGAQLPTDSVQLGLILDENLKQTIDIGETLRYVRTLTEEASDIAYFSRDAVKSVNNLRLLAQNPGEFSQFVLRSWATAYPEVRDIYAHVLDIHMAARDMRDPNFYRHYDSYAPVRAFDALQNIERGAYEIALRDLDRWHIASSHDPALDAIQKQHAEAVEAFSEIAEGINATGISPQRAQAHTAKTSAISAMANVEAAQALEKMVSHQQVSFMSQQQTISADRKQMMVMEYEARTIRMDWRLRPSKKGAK